jgi:3-phosphoshikimate 1-carboxyvinyltransferase
MFAIPALDLVPLGAAAGTVRLPGSKSISNRLLLLAGLSEGETTLVDLLDSDDTRVMLDALQALGCRIEPDGSTTRIVGFGGRPVVAAADLFLGNAGTAMRPLTAALAVLACEHGGEYSLRGVPRMHERPIGDLVDALRGLGCSIDCTGAGRLSAAAPARRPARPEPAGEGARRRLQPVPHRAAAGAAAGHRTAGGADRGGGRADLQALHRDHAQPAGALRHRGAARGLVAFHAARRAAATARRVLLPVEADASSASYFIALGALAGMDAPVRIEGVGRRLDPGRHPLRRGRRGDGCGGAQRSRTRWRCGAAPGRSGPSTSIATTSPTPP